MVKDKPLFGERHVFRARAPAGSLSCVFLLILSLAQMGCSTGGSFRPLSSQRAGICTPRWSTIWDRICSQPAEIVGLPVTVAGPVNGNSSLSSAFGNHRQWALLLLEDSADSADAQDEPGSSLTPGLWRSNRGDLIFDRAITGTITEASEGVLAVDIGWNTPLFFSFGGPLEVFIDRASDIAFFELVGIGDSGFRADQNGRSWIEIDGRRYWMACKRGSSVGRSTSSTNFVPCTSSPLIMVQVVEEWEDGRSVQRIEGG